MTVRTFCKRAPRQGRITESQAMAAQAKEIRQQAEPPEEHVLVRRFADDD